MDKPSKLRNKLLKFLPHAATFRSPPVSPIKTISTVSIISMLPSEVEESPRMQALTHESPHSPKFSCMGQVRFSNKKKRTKPIKRVISLPRNTMQVSCPKDEVKKKKPPEINIIKGPNEGGKSDVFHDDTMVSKQAVLSLVQIKRFSSARGALSSFDWRTHGAVVVPDCQDGRLNKEKDSKGNKFTTRNFIYRISASFLL